MTQRKSLSSTTAPGVYDGVNQAYSDSNPPQTLQQTQFDAASVLTPPAGQANTFTPDGKSLMMKAPDGTVTAIGPGPMHGAVPADHNFKLWTSDPTLNTGGTAIIPTAGTIYFTRMVNHTGASISIGGGGVYVTTAGATLTNVGFGLYSIGALGTTTATLVSSSVNANGATTTAFQATGWKPVTFGTSLTVAPEAAFAIGFWVTGTTLPILMRGANSAAATNMNLAAPNLRWGSSTTGLTTTAPATLNLSTASSASNAYWTAAI